MKYQFKRENVKSLRDIAYESIKEAILSSDLQPGEKLTESDLSEQLGISRGPIREAFRQLERDGLVHSQPYKGTVVAEFSMEETDQVYIPIRQQIERYACCQAMELFGEEDYTFLESCITEMESNCVQRKIEAISRNDAEFHRYIVSKCTSGVLVSIWDSLAAHFYGRIFFQNRLKWEKPEFSYIPEEHRELLEAIRNSNKKAINNLIKIHIQ